MTSRVNPLAKQHAPLFFEIQGYTPDGRKESVVIPLEELPSTFEEIRLILISELPPLLVWLQIVAHLVRTNRFDDAEAVFSLTKKGKFAAKYADVVFDRALVLNAEAAFRLHQVKLIKEKQAAEAIAAASANKESSSQADLRNLYKPEIDRLLNLASVSLSEASQLDPTNERLKSVLLVTEAELYLANGDSDRALMCFNNSLEIRPISLRAMLGRVRPCCVSLVSKEKYTNPCIFQGRYSV